MRKLSAVLLLAVFTPALTAVAQRSAIPSGTEITVRTDEPIDADVQTPKPRTSTAEPSAKTSSDRMAEY